MSECDACGRTQVGHVVEGLNFCHECYYIYRTNS